MSPTEKTGAPSGAGRGFRGRGVAPVTSSGALTCTTAPGEACLASWPSKRAISDCTRSLMTFSSIAFSLYSVLEVVSHDGIPDFSAHLPSYHLRSDPSAASCVGRTGVYCAVVVDDLPLQCFQVHHRELRHS